jgi:hypothetical protein
MGNAERLCDAACVVDVLSGATTPLAARGCAVIIELQGDANDVVAFVLEQRGGNGGVDAAGHRDHDPLSTLGGDASCRPRCCRL